MKFYFTFGQAHSVSVAGFTYDKDIIVEIEALTSNDARQRMFNIFGGKWSMQYNELPNLSLFPRGIRKIS